ncbi:TonB-dependent receptor [Niastella koreensis]|nr:TonB-dependent receptor [Niastella koreensis]
MKLIVLLMIVSLSRVSAEGFGQGITIHEKSASIPAILHNIEKQSKYNFFYEKADFPTSLKITVHFDHVPVETVLDECFKNQPVTYRIFQQTIVIKKSVAPKPEDIVSSPDTTITVVGLVQDEKGRGLPGVSVTVKNSKYSVNTDINGRYHIPAPTNGILIFTFVGMQKQEVAIAGKTTINITLNLATEELGDVVVIGYGTQKRRDINGAISSVKAIDIATIPQPSVDQLLQGKAAGLSITQNSGAPGSNTSVRVRGVTSLSGTNEPLYVIDGVPISGDANNSSTSGRSPLQTAAGYTYTQSSVSPLAMINPNDIESIDVLKDASATAIYGNRASNGVIIITTKRGKNGNAKINYNGYAGQQQVSKYIHMMDLKQYARLQDVMSDIFGVGRRPDLADSSLLGAGTDWQRLVLRKALQQSHQLSVSGGKDGMNYYVSGGMLQQDGIVIGSGFKRYSFRSNLDAQVKEWFKLGLTLAGNRTAEDVVQGDNNGIIYNALLQAPDLTAYNADGSYSGPPASDPLSVTGVINPVAQAKQITNHLNRSNLNTNLYNDIRFTRDLTLRSELGGDFNFSDNNLFTPSYTWGRFVNTNASLNERSQQSTYGIWKEYLTYQHTFAGKHILTALAGHEVQQANWRGTQGFRQGFYSNTVQSLNLGQATTATNDEYKGSQSQESFYARVIYNYSNRYSFTATIRKDKSSKFAPEHQIGYFPAFAASWKLSDEAFMQNIKTVADNIKIRLGYGQVGNQEIPNYLYGSPLNASVTGLGTGFLLNQIANPNLKWQTSIQYNAGLDFSLFNRRVDATVDVYKKTSRNFLFQLPLPAYLVGDFTYLGGINPPYVNLGRVENQGIDITLNTHNIVSEKVKWNTSIIFSHYNNTVKELGTGLDELIGKVTNGFLDVAATRTVVGGPIGEFYGYRVKGLFKTDDQLSNAPQQFNRPVGNNSAGTWLGDVQYQDLDNNKVIDAKDRVALGSPNPKFTYGITNNFTFGDFDLSIFLYGSYGAKILNLLDRTLGGLAGPYQNQYASVAGYWTPTNPNTDIPAPKVGTDNPNIFVSDRFIHSGSYLRIQNINLGWNVPARWLHRAKIGGLKIYSSVQNLHTFTSYNGYDPEIGASNQSAILTNIDNGRYPLARTITVGMNVQL